MIKKNNFVVLIVEVIAIVLAIISVSFAIKYVMDQININATAGNLAVDYTGNLTLPSTNLIPIGDSSVSSNAENVMRVNFSVKGASTNPTDRPIIYDVILSDLEIDCQLKSKYLKWQLNKNGSKLSEGSFSPTFDTIKDGKLYLTEIQQDLPSSNANADNYEFILWLSESCSDITNCSLEDDQSYLSGKKISGKIETILYTNSKKNLTRTPGKETGCPNAPLLAENMIPIMYNGSSWVKADSSNFNNQYKWYDYDNKQWANAVLVSQNNRQAYLDAEAGTQIPEADILAYYVWIPRYKYKVFNITKTMNTDSYDAKTTGIDIVFEKETETTGEITCNDYDFSVTEGNGLSETCSGSNGEYYTHPAFTFGDKQLTGIWVGKFEVSNGISEIKVKPNVSSLREQTSTSFYSAIKNMQKESNIYGLNTDTSVVDSHMMKNMEWGAVAYLTHSDYGRCNGSSCTEVGINDNSSFTTGGGNYVSNTNQSTTGNIYGIYDMSGGAYEYVMGNMSSSSGSYTYYASSGGSNLSYSTSTEKYVDTYANGSTSNDQKAYNRARLGDATGEVVVSSNNGWYNDYAYFVYSSYSWFQRGGGYNGGTGAGVFYLYSHNGNRYTNSSARGVVSVLG